MMNNKKNLNDLFANLRTDAPNIEPEQLREHLASGKHIYPAGVMGIPSHRKQRKGIYIMSAIALILIGAFYAFYPQNDTTLPGNAPQQYLAHQNGSPVKESPQTTISSRTQPESSKGSELKTPEAPQTPKTPSLTAPVVVVGITPSKIAEADYAKLGLEKREGKGLGFFFKVGKDKYQKIYIPEQGWGVIMRPEEVSTPTTVIEPVIITDGRGNKRYVNYSDENSRLHYENYKGNSSAMADDDGSIEKEETEMVMNVRGDSGKSKHVISHSSSFEINADSTHSDIRKLVKEALVATQNSMNYKKYEHNDKQEISVNLNIDEVLRGLDTMNTGSLQDIQRAIDSAMKPERMRELSKRGKVRGTIIINDNGKGKDSLSLKMQKTMAEHDKIMKEEIVQSDSLGRHSARKMRMKMFVHSDSNSKMPDFGDWDFDKLWAKMSEKLNHLIPVLVREATTVTHNDAENRDYDNGVIMWFENTKEFCEALPNLVTEYIITPQKGTVLTVNVHKDGKEMTLDELLKKYPDGNPNDSKKYEVVVNEPLILSGIFSNALVYPNPASTKATVRFNLTQARSVAFSVHDITGKRMVDAGTLNNLSAGYHEHELQLGKLPAGIYLVVLTSDKGEQSVQRIVVEK